jgi:large subunit ribosomal protein L30
MAAKPGSSDRAQQRDASAGRGSRAKLRVTQTKSTISHIARNRATIKALGLHGIGSSSVVPDNDATRGMVRQVRFLVSVEEIEETQTKRSRSGSDRAATPEDQHETA